MCFVSIKHEKPIPNAVLNSYRLFGTTHPFLAQLSNCALIIGLRQHYELISAPSTKQKILFSIGSAAIIALMSLHATVEIAAFFTGIEYMSVEQLLALHVPLHTLISGAFIYYGWFPVFLYSN